MLVQQSCLLGLNNVLGLGVFSADVHSDDLLILEDDVKQSFEVVQAYIPLIPVGYGAIVVEHILVYGYVNGFLQVHVGESLPPLFSQLCFFADELNS